MAVVWILCLAAASLCVVLVVALGRRHGDEVGDAVRSFDEFRSALSPEVEGLAGRADDLGRRLDPVDRAHEPTGPGRDPR